MGAVSGAVSGLAGPAGGAIATIATHAIVGAASGAAGQVVSNALDHKPLVDGVLLAAGVGALTGGVEGGFTAYLARGANAASKAISTVCKLSFSPETLVATPSGEQAIVSLKVGDHVTAYDPATGQASTQTVQHVWINHDDDLIDVTLQTDNSKQAVPASVASKQQEAEVAAHGLRAPPSTSAAANRARSPHTTAAETVHTTAKHPWLTVEQGWMTAGRLHVGEQVVRLDGTTATVTALRVVPGAATMYNLEVSQVHTFAVGFGQYVVHNCDGADKQLASMARGLQNALRQDGADISHATIGVARHADGRLLVSLNQRVAANGVHDLTDSTAGALQGILKRPGWAQRGLQYVGPTHLRPVGTPFNLLPHAEDYLLDQGRLTALEATKNACSICRARIGREQPWLL